jgi:hypothetical protein
MFPFKEEILLPVAQRRVVLVEWNPDWTRFNV